MVYPYHYTQTLGYLLVLQILIDGRYSCYEVKRYIYKSNQHGIHHNDDHGSQH